MRPRSRRLSVVAFAALVGGVAAADEPPAKPVLTPAEAAAKIRAAMPAPSDAGGFSVDADFVLKDEVAGAARIRATVETFDGAPWWRLEDALRVGSEETPVLTLQNVDLARQDLRFGSSTRVKKTAEGEETTTATVGEKGVTVRLKTGEAEPKESLIEAPADLASGGLASLLLFLRACPAEPATYEVSCWNGDRREVQKRKVEVKGVARLIDSVLGLDVEAWTAVATLPNVTLAVHLDPKDRSFLALRSVESGWWFVKQGLASEPAPAWPDANTSAASAMGAGARILLGILAGDEALFASAFDWPTFAAASDSIGGPTDAKGARERVVGWLRPFFRAETREAALLVAAGALAGAEEKPEGGAVRVTIPSTPAISCTAKKFEDGWRVVSFDIPKAAPPK